MEKEELKNRWQESNNKPCLSRILQCFTNGGRITESLSPFGLYENRIDFRGLEITPEQRTSCSKILKCRFAHVDFSCSVFGDAWTEGCLFEDVVFGEADMQGYRDLGNKYLDCSFVKTDFSGAGIGHRGSSYNNCLFREVKFRRNGFVRPEFVDCLFDNCKLKSADFNAGSFVRCKFIGKMYDVCFSNGYRLGEELNKYFGVPRENKMLNVSFAEAELKMICLRNGCDLSTVVLPQKGEYRLYTSHKKRLEALEAKIDEFAPNERKTVRDFFEIYMTGASRQDMYIFNCDEMRQRYGEAVANKMIAVLDHAV